MVMVLHGHMGADASKSTFCSCAVCNSPARICSRKPITQSKHGVIVQPHMQSCMQGVRTGSQQQKNMTDTYTKDREQRFDICRWEIISQREDNKERVQT